MAKKTLVSCCIIQSHNSVATWSSLAFLDPVKLWLRKKADMKVILILAICLHYSIGIELAENLIDELTWKKISLPNFGLDVLQERFSPMLQEVQERLKQCQDLTSLDKHQPSMTCLIKDGRYSGTDLADSVITELRSPTAQQCQQKCQDNAECRHFLYFSEQHYQRFKHFTCRLLRMSGDIVMGEVGHISGPKFCSDFDPSLYNGNDLEVLLSANKPIKTLRELKCEPLDCGKFGQGISDLNELLGPDWDITATLNSNQESAKAFAQILQSQCSKKDELLEKIGDGAELTDVGGKAEVLLENGEDLEMAEGFIETTDNAPGMTTDVSESYFTVENAKFAPEITEPTEFEVAQTEPTEPAEENQQTEVAEPTEVIESTEIAETRVPSETAKINPTQNDEPAGTIDVTMAAVFSEKTEHTTTLSINLIEPSAEDNDMESSDALSIGNTIRNPKKESPDSLDDRDDFGETTQTSNDLNTDNATHTEDKHDNNASSINSAIIFPDQVHGGPQNLDSSSEMYPVMVEAEEISPVEESTSGNEESPSGNQIIIEEIETSPVAIMTSSQVTATTSVPLLPIEDYDDYFEHTSEEEVEFLPVSSNSSTKTVDGFVVSSSSKLSWLEPLIQKYPASQQESVLPRRESRSARSPKVEDSVGRESHSKDDPYIYPQFISNDGPITIPVWIKRSLRK